MGNRLRVQDYIRVEVRGLQFSNYATAWVERRRQEVEQELLSRGYLRSAESYIRNHMIPFPGPEVEADPVGY